MEIVFIHQVEGIQRLGNGESKLDRKVVHFFQGGGFPIP